MERTGEMQRNSTAVLHGLQHVSLIRRPSIGSLGENPSWVTLRYS